MGIQALPNSFEAYAELCECIAAVSDELKLSIKNPVDLAGRRVYMDIDGQKELVHLVEKKREFDTEMSNRDITLAIQREIDRRIRTGESIIKGYRIVVRAVCTHVPNTIGIVAAFRRLEE